MRHVLVNGVVNKDKVIDLIKDAYFLFNGWINKHNPSLDLVFDDRKILDRTFGIILDAVAKNTYVEFYPNTMANHDVYEDMKDCFDTNDEDTECMYMTYIAMIVMHELSHLEQNDLKYLDNKESKDPDEITGSYDECKLENANECRVIHFYRFHKEKIDKALDFKTDVRGYIVYSPYLSDMISDRIKEEHWYGIKSMKDKLDVALLKFTRYTSKEIKELCKEHNTEYKVHAVFVNKTKKEFFESLEDGSFTFASKDVYNFNDKRELMEIEKRVETGNMYYMLRSFENSLGGLLVAIIKEPMIESDDNIFAFADI